MARLIPTPIAAITPPREAPSAIVLNAYPALMLKKKSEGFDLNEDRNTKYNGMKLFFFPKERCTPAPIPMALMNSLL